jgi:hypothetical protein
MGLTGAKTLEWALLATLIVTLWLAHPPVGWAALLVIALTKTAFYCVSKPETGLDLLPEKDWWLPGVVPPSPASTASVATVRPRAAELLGLGAKSPSQAALGCVDTPGH